MRFELAVPRIIRLLFYDRLPRQAVKFNRRNIFARDRNRCQYCGKRFPTSELSLDHVVPRSRGGEATWENIVCCCVKCNVRKGGRTPEEAGMKLITEPVKPKRSPDRHAAPHQREVRLVEAVPRHGVLERRTARLVSLPPRYTGEQRGREISSGSCSKGNVRWPSN